MKVVSIIQARMGSTRLPGKVLKKVLDQSLLEYQLERIQKSKWIDEIVIATTTKKADDAIVDLCNQLLFPFYRGSEEDVLSRYYEAASHYKAEVIVRLTSDCPIIDPNVIDKVIDAYFKKEGPNHYVSNIIDRTYPRGMDTEVFSFKTLETAHRKAQLKSDREHVTSFVRNNPSQFKCMNVTYDEDHSHHRWTVDTQEDFNLVRRIIEKLYPKKPQFSLEETLELLKRYPDWNLINSHIDQKKP